MSNMRSPEEKEMIIKDYLSRKQLMDCLTKYESLRITPSKTAKCAIRQPFLHRHAQTAAVV